MWRGTSRRDRRSVSWYCETSSYDYLDNGWNSEAVTSFFKGLFAEGTVTIDDVDVFGFSIYPINNMNATCSHTLSESFPVSPEGQLQWAAAIIGVLDSLPGSSAGGFFYWEPGFLKMYISRIPCKVFLFDSYTKAWPYTIATAYPSVVNMFV
ncbi:hypothetical protein PsorP6_006187 [Peronosclerospora sorghi]|uniref:Uncharacterized protein n=1 Tax=Peronosclerospora sorghi TaxID=230839 RepID=A0ACC0W1H5_9STRA|nr:hypothetical protein PsorP6_006187 [Peronosclerospora sorghi]